MQDMYERWLACNEDWKSSTWALGLETQNKETRRGARRWMTKAQIEKKYESKDVASEIVKLKMQPEFSHQRKKHPDLPDRAVAHLNLAHLILNSVFPTLKNQVSKHAQFASTSYISYPAMSRPARNSSQDMMLFLCWDEESQETEDCTILRNSHESRDAGTSRKRRKAETSSSQADGGILCVKNYIVRT